MPDFSPGRGTPAFSSYNLDPLGLEISGGRAIAERGARAGNGDSLDPAGRAPPLITGSYNLISKVGGFKTIHQNGVPTEAD